ncbi:MAG: MMPL family transporter [Acidimicrobiia bacterium]
MSRWLHRVGLFSVRHRRLVVVVWVLVVAGAVMANRFVGAGQVDNFEIPGVESQQARDLLAERFPSRAGATAMVVFHAEGASVRAETTAAGIEASVASIRAMPSVLAVTDPLASPRSVSADASTAFAAVQFDATTAELGKAAVEDLRAAAAPAESAGVQVELGGELPTVLKERTTGPAEAIGVVAALIILFVTFRSFVAAGMPLVTAVAGLVVGLSLVGLLGAVLDIPSIAPRLATMLGLGVGIDYALFVLSRHRDNLAKGMSVADAAAGAIATAGQAVVFAGGTVVVAILGLRLAGIPFVATLGYSASVVVAVAVTVAVTLMPALFGFAGTKLAPRRAAASAPGERRHSEGGWVRWARRVAGHPWRYAIAATTVLVVLAIPVVDMRLGQADAGTDPAGATQRRAYDLLAAGFGDGFNGPLLVVVDLAGAADHQSVLESSVAAIRATDGVVAVSPPELNRSGDTAVVTVVPASKPQAQATSDLVHALRASVLPGAFDGTGAHAYVGGPTAGFIDQSAKIQSRLPLFILAVVLVSFLFLMGVFRSVFVPLKAALMNLLSIGAAYGVVVAVFQWGWGRSLIGLDEAVPIASFVPMMMFAILFGLSMDYEVFILSRIREEHIAGHSNVDSVVAGLGATAKVVTAAALIMISVFLGFVVGDDPVVKMMGVGLATAVAVDATIVRVVLVPATMALLGDANWWIPRWLDRVLPRIDVEGTPPEVPAPVPRVEAAPPAA